MKITDLGYDALSLLSAAVAPSDVNSWRLVCRTLGHAAHPYRFRRLALRDPSQLRDACASVANTPGCAQHILYLTMGNGCCGSPNEPGDPEIRDAPILRIAELMYTTVNLVSLTMEAAESFLANNSALVATVAACSRLETLVLNQHYGYLSHGTALLFAELHAPLRSLELGKLAGEEFPVHVLVLLQHFAPTLETLDLDFVEIGPWREDRPAPVFSYVTELVMRIASVHTQTLERAFPALHELSLQLKDEYSPTPLIPTYHADNLINASAHWKDLALLSGDIGGLWTLTLRDVEVDLLVIHGHAHDEDEMEARRAVLRGVRPHMLHVWVCADTEGETMLAHDLPEHATSVRILDLNVIYRMPPWGETFIYSPRRLMTFLLNMPDLMKSISGLLFLRLRVEPSGISSQFRPEDEVRVAIVQKLFAQIDSLMLITISWKGVGWFSTTYRRVHVSVPDAGPSHKTFVPDERLDEAIGHMDIQDLHRLRTKFGDVFDKTLRSLASDPDSGDAMSEILFDK